MKPQLIIAACLLIVSCANAQKVKESEIPTAVKDNFTKKFPGIKPEKWEKEDSNFEAEFDLNKVETSALFDAKGDLLEIESEIAVSALPKAVSDYLAKNHSGKKIKEASKITEANGKIKYEAEIKGKDLLFDENGSLIK